MRVIGANPDPEVSMHWQHQAVRKVIEERSQGKLLINFIGGKDIVPIMEQWDALKGGGPCDSVWTPVSRAGGIVLEAPALQLARMSAADMRASGFFDKFNESMAKGNVRLLMNGDSSLYTQFIRMYPNFPMEKPEDFKGRKIAATPNEQAVVETFGGIAVPMSPFEMYEAVERGVAEGCGCTADDTVFRFSFCEVCDYFITPGFGGPDYAWSVNLDFWNKIPPDLQKLVLDAVVEVEKEWEPKWTEIHKGWPPKWVSEGGMEEILFTGDDAERWVKAYYDYHWGEVINKSPVEGAKLKALCGQ